ncbi:MAG: HEAT repeat domain-containing protein [Gemmatimonadaceae bacterium]
MRHALFGAAILVFGPTTIVSSQSFGRQVSTAPDGPVQFNFAARPGVCGGGPDVIRIGKSSFGSWRNSSRDVCIHGPVYVVLTRREGETTSLRAYVGSPGSDRGTDLGLVAVKEATDYLLALAPRLPGSAGSRAILAAAIADSTVIWPTLLTLARDSSIPRATQEAATFWLGRAAAVAATGQPDTALDEDAEDDATSVRTQAVFALSQLSDNDGVPELLQVARTHRDALIRKRAIFWLGESGDPRALALFEELLRAK